MAGYPPPYPPPTPPPGPPYGADWRYQRRVMKDQARMQRDMIRAQQQAYRQQLRGMRRGSILGPLLVITIGIVFFLVQTGHLESHRLWDWYSRFWPFLLIGGGIIMLLEWAFDQYTQSDSTQPRYRRSIGGGVFTLILLLGFTGLILSGIRQGGSSKLFPNLHLNQDNLDEFMGDKHESDQSLSQAFPAGTSLSIDNPRGDISVSGTSDDNQIHIDVHKQVYTRSDSEADSKAQQLSPKLTPNGTTLNLSLPSIEGGRADLVITVPAAATTTVSANHGDVHVTELKAPANVTANHGDITISAITGPVGAHINNGDSSFSARSITGPVSIEGHARDLSISDISGIVSMDGDFYGTTHIERVRGAVRFHSSRTDLRLARLDGEIEFSPGSDFSIDQAVGPIVLSTRSHNVTFERVAGDISVTNRNGSVDITSAPPLGNIAVENRNGSVNVNVPEQAGFTVQAETTNGDAENDFSIPVQENDNRKSFGGVVGKGGPTVRITTTQGDIALKKASVEPLPPVPPPPPPISIRGADGSNVTIGNGGVNIHSSEGSSVVVGKNGVRIVTNTDGGSSFTAKDGTTLTTSPDGDKVFVGHDGTRYTISADGSRSYAGHDGTRITVGSDGSRVGIGPSGKALSNSQIADRLRQADEEVSKTTQQRDSERKR